MWGIIITIVGGIIALICTLLIFSAPVTGISASTVALLGCIVLIIFIFFLFAGDINWKSEDDRNKKILVEKEVNKNEMQEPSITSSV